MSCSILAWWSILPNLTGSLTANYMVSFLTLVLKHQVSVPKEKINTLKSQLQQVHISQSSKILASVNVKISMLLAREPDCWVMARSMYAVLNAQEFCCPFLPISKEERDELEQGIWHSPLAVRVVCTDASNTSCAGYTCTVEHGCQIANGLWLEEEADLSFTWRKLRAVRMITGRQTAVTG